MKGVLTLTLISMSLICIFWYTEIATPFQREYTHNKAKELGGAILRTTSSASEAALETGKEIYEGSSEVISKAKEIGSEAIKKGERFLDENSHVFENAKTKAGNVFQLSEDELPEF